MSLFSRLNVIQKWRKLHPVEKTDIIYLAGIVMTTSGYLGAVIGTATGVVSSINDAFYGRYNKYPGSGVISDFKYTINLTGNIFKYAAIGAFIGATAPVSIPAIVIYDKYYGENESEN